MFGKRMLQTMFEYNHSTNIRLLEGASQLTPEQWAAPVHPFGRSLYETLFHVLVVEEEWVYLCQQGRPSFRQRTLADFPDRAALGAFSDRLGPATHAYLAGLDDAGFTATVTALLPDEQEHTVVIWRVLVHALYHSAQHRSEAAAILTSYGHSPGFIDFFGYMWERD